MASKTMPGIINYKATCKQCDWVFESDSTAKVQSATREHRKKHWRDSPHGRLEDKRRMRDFYYYERRTLARRLEKSREDLDAQISLLSAANKMIGKRDEMVNRINELREKIKRDQMLFDIADQKWGAYL